MERVGLLAHLSSRLVSLSASGQSPMQQLRFRLNKRTSSPLSCQICVKHVNKRIKLSFFIPHPLMHCLSELGTCELIMGSNSPSQSSAQMSTRRHLVTNQRRGQFTFNSLPFQAHVNQTARVAHGGMGAWNRANNSLEVV